MGGLYVAGGGICADLGGGLDGDDDDGECDGGELSTSGSCGGVGGFCFGVHFQPLMSIAKIAIARGSSLQGGGGLLGANFINVYWWELVDLWCTYWCRRR